MAEPVGLYRILLTGSRDWGSPEGLALALGIAVGEGPHRSRVVVVHGACPTGADAIADRICRDHGIAVEPHPADWEQYGRAAGPLRNAEMVALGADVCLAFIRNGSRGATHCAGLAEKAGIPTERFLVP